MENHLSWEANTLSHNYENFRLLLIPKFHCHIHNLHTARSIQTAKYATRFNLNLPYLPFSPDVLILSVSQSKPAKISELYSMMEKKTQHSVKHRTGSFYTGYPVVFKYACIKEISMFVVYTQH